MMTESTIFEKLPEPEADLVLQHKIIVGMIFNERFALIRALCANYGYGQIDPDDAIQDLILYLLHKDIPFLLDLKSKGMAGLRKCLKNKVIDHARKRKTREKHTSNYASVLTEAQDEMEEEKIQLIGFASNNLKPRDQKIIQLTLEGFNVKEIAELLNMNPKTVSTAKNRSISKIKNALQVA